jgi:hypothetical protein
MPTQVPASGWGQRVKHVYRTVSRPAGDSRHCRWRCRTFHIPHLRILHRQHSPRRSVKEHPVMTRLWSGWNLNLKKKQLVGGACRMGQGHSIPYSELSRPISLHPSCRLQRKSAKVHRHSSPARVRCTRARALGVQGFRVNIWGLGFRNSLKPSLSASL